MKALNFKNVNIPAHWRRNREACGQMSSDHLLSRLTTGQSSGHPRDAPYRVQITLLKDLWGLKYPFFLSASRQSSDAGPMLLWCRTRVRRRWFDIIPTLAQHHMLVGVLGLTDALIIVGYLCNNNSFLVTINLLITSNKFPCNRVSLLTIRGVIQQFYFKYTEEIVIFITA